MKPDFWYIIGSDYEIIVFREEQEARAAHERLSEGVADYYQVREGWYGKEFSGWIGRGEPWKRQEC